MPDLHPVVAALDHRSRALDLSSREVAKRIGVTKTCVTKWRAGDSTPYVRNAVRWADTVGLRIAAVDEQQVFAEGLAVITDLANLRKDRGLRQGEVARIRSVAQASVCRLEHAPARGTDVQLAALDAQLSALGLRLTVLNGRRDAAA